ncbi:unnamed protein product, partial [Caretta caretta]
MAWAPLLLTLLTYCSGSSSQPVLTQTPSVSVSPGENVRLACTMPSGYSIGSYRVQWYQQKSDSAPRFVYHYYTSSDQGRGTGIPARFTVSPDSSRNRWNLVIAGSRQRMMLIITVLYGMIEVTLITATQGDRELRPKLSNQPVRLCPR